MPERKISSRKGIKNAINRSLNEWGASKTKIYDNFVPKIMSQVMEAKKNDNEEDEKENFLEEKRNVSEEEVVLLPQSLEKTFELFFILALEKYLDDNILKRYSRSAVDTLEHSVTIDNAKNILNWPPYCLNKDGKACLKKHFSHLKNEYRKSWGSLLLDPFQRFQLNVSQEKREQIAFDQTFGREGWLEGNAFEAIVAWYITVYCKHRCYRCKKIGDLVYCGGSSSSWRDIYCRNCQSCYEIKTKADATSIDKVIKRNNLPGGSFYRWCKERYTNRKVGTDFVILVNRTPTARNKSYYWEVSIAEIEAVVPLLVDLTFAEINSRAAKIKAKTIRNNSNDEKDERFFTIRSSIRMKNHSLWFKIPTVSSENSKLQSMLERIFRVSFEIVFPNKWNEVNEQQGGGGGSTPGSTIDSYERNLSKKCNLTGNSVESPHAKKISSEIIRDQTKNLSGSDIPKTNLSLFTDDEINPFLNDYHDAFDEIWEETNFEDRCDELAKEALMKLKGGKMPKEESFHNTSGKRCKGKRKNSRKGRQHYDNVDDSY